jgi:hypothetical protein
MTQDVESLLPEIEPTETPPELPEAEMNMQAPPDKEPQARDEDGKFKGKEPAKEPEAKKPEEKPEPKQDRTIPLAAHLEERKALKAELEAMRKELEALKNPPKPPAPEPEDPKAYTDYKLNAALEQLKQQQTEAQKQVEQVAQTALMSREQTERLAFSQQLQAAEAAFVKETPDYYDALAHVRGVRAHQLRLMVPDITDEQIIAQISQEELNLAMQLARSGRNPISTVYQLAAAYGYQKKADDPSLKLPDVPGQKQLPPDQTLGSGGRGGDTYDASDQKDDFDLAWQELFGKRKAS